MDLNLPVNNLCPLWSLLLTPELISLLSSVIENPDMIVNIAPCLIQSLSGITFHERSILDKRFGDVGYANRISQLKQWANDTETRKIQLLCSKHVMACILQIRKPILPCMTMFCIGHGNIDQKFFAKSFWINVFNNYTLSDSQKTVLLAFVCRFALKNKITVLDDNVVHVHSNRHKVEMAETSSMCLDMYLLLKQFQEDFYKTNIIEIRNFKGPTQRNIMTKKDLFEQFLQWICKVAPDLDISSLQKINNKKYENARLKKFLTNLLWRILINFDTEEENVTLFWVVNKVAVQDEEEEEVEEDHENAKRIKI